jgi:hypothetical protein
MFQDVWTVCLPWAKSMFDEKGQVDQVRPMMCTFVEGKEKLLPLKLDSLLKHQDYCKAEVYVPMVDVGNFHFNKDFIHVKNEQCYKLSTNENISNLLLISISLPTDVSCLIMKA